MQAVRKLQPELKQLLLGLADLKRLDTTAAKPDVDIEKRERELCKQADKVKDSIVQALDDLTKHFNAATGLKEEPARPSGRPLRFCKGAILCQTGKADASKLAVEADNQVPGRWGFVCQYCYLEVADYNAVRFSHDGKPVVYAEMLAASHVMACDSFSNRRAYYKCLACYQNHRDVDFSSASALEIHMRGHPGYSFVKNEPEVIKATHAKIQNYIVEPSPDRVLTGSVVDNDTVDDVSPVSSPKLSSQNLANNPIEPVKLQTLEATIRGPIPTEVPASARRPVPVSKSPRPVQASAPPNTVELPIVSYDGHDAPVELLDESHNFYPAYPRSSPAPPTSTPQLDSGHRTATNGGSSRPHAGSSLNVNSGSIPSGVYEPNPFFRPTERQNVPSRGSIELQNSARTQQSDQMYHDAPTQQIVARQLSGWNGWDVPFPPTRQPPAPKNTQIAEASQKSDKRSKKPAVFK